jgi:hypothetical protein
MTAVVPSVPVVSAPATPIATSPSTGTIIVNITLPNSN